MKNLAIVEKARETLQALDVDAVLLVGTDNTQYLSGAVLPFAPYRPWQTLAIFWEKGDEPVCLCPAEWETTLRETGWIQTVACYPAQRDDGPGLLDLIALEIGRLKLASPTIGVDFSRVTHHLFSALRTRFPEVHWTGCDEWLATLRSQKTPAELDLLEEAAYMTDHGINGAIHHVTVDRRTTALTLAEELRVHTEERGIDLVGYHAAAHVVAGDELIHFWANPPKYGYSLTEDLHPGETVRMRVQTCLDGYWADSTRTMIQGEPTEQQSQAYRQLVALREAALRLIKPGAACCEVYAGICSAAREADISLEEGLELGHGIGRTPCEPPFLSPAEPTILKEGMTLVLDFVVRDEKDHLWQAKDTLVVTDGGNRIVGWYKDWREPYIPIASI